MQYAPAARAALMAGTGAVEGAAEATAKDSSKTEGALWGGLFGSIGSGVGDAVKAFSNTGQLGSKEVAVKALGNKAKKQAAGSGFEKVVAEIADTGDINAFGARATQQGADAAKETLKNTAKLRNEAGKIRKQAVASVDGLLPPDALKTPITRLQENLALLQKELENEPIKNSTGIEAAKKAINTLNEQYATIQKDGKGAGALLNTLFDQQTSASSKTGSAKLVGRTIANALDESDQIIGANIPQLKDSLATANSMFSQAYGLDDTIKAYTTQKGISSINRKARDVAPNVLTRNVVSGKDLGRLSALEAANLPDSIAATQSARDLGSNAKKLRDLADLQDYSKEAYSSSGTKAALEAGTSMIPNMKGGGAIRSATKGLFGPSNPFDTLTEQAVKSAEASRLRNVIESQYGSGPAKGLEMLLSKGVPLTAEVLQRVARTFAIKDPDEFEQSVMAEYNLGGK
jgi:hypothetical protein